MTLEDPRRARYETELEESGQPIPLFHRGVWLSEMAPGRSVFVGAFNPEDRCLGGCSFMFSPTMALPGHFAVRIERFGSGMDPGAAEAILTAAEELARSEPKVLRVELEVFTPDPSTHRRLVETASGLGFVDAPEHSAYQRTAVLALQPAEDELLSSFHHSARRNIRDAEAPEVELRPISRPDEGSAMHRLLVSTMARTRGPRLDVDWTRLIEFATTHPELIRIVGAYRTDVERASELLAFAVGRHHGDHVEYFQAASSRPRELGRLSLGYAPVWDLIRWAKRTGASWFDFGGITRPGDVRHDRLKGVSEFKHRFTRTDLHVRTELVLYPPGPRAHIARAVSAAARYARGRIPGLS